MEPNEIQDQLGYFTGTERYYRYQSNLVLTDGSKFVADACGAYWLMDVLWSYLPRIKSEAFAFARLSKHADESATFTLADDNPPQTVYASQDISWTDFPLDEITFYVIRDPAFWVLLLPSEY